MYAVSDFSISDISFNSVSMQYNIDNKTIDENILNEIKNLNGIEGVSNLLYKDSTFNLSKKSQDKFVTLYEDINPSIFEQYSNSPEWKKAYDTMKNKGDLGASVFGFDEYALSKCDVYIGDFDKEKFESGKYILVSSLKDNGEESRIFDIGDKVVIDNNEYEVMGYIDIPYPLTYTTNALETIFSEYFVISSNQFSNVYKNNPIVQTIIDVEDKYITETESFLENYSEDINPDLKFTSRNTYRKEFEDSNKAQIIMGQTLSVVIFVIGILNFINSIMTSIISRKREFAMLQSIGMTKNQLSLMLVTEGICYSILIILASLSLGFVASTVGLRMFLSTKWACTYVFTMTPILISIPIILIFACIIPYLCFINVKKQSIVERLREVE